MEDADRQPARHSRRFSNELIEDAQRIFGERAGREVTAEEARQMLENLTGFFETLIDWDRAQKKKDAEEAAELRSQTADRSQTPSETLLREGRQER